MGAYENPAMIQGPKTGELWGQAFASFGQSIAAGIMSYQDVLAKSEAKRQKQIEANQRVAYEVEEQYYKDLNKNYVKSKEKTPNLSDQFKSQSIALLEGDGTMENPGAIKAQTLLRTNAANLTKEEKQRYRNIINEYQTFSDSMITGGGNLLVDLEDSGKLAAGDIDTTHAWVGNNSFEKRASQYTSYVLSNKTIPGAESTSKKLIKGENGEPIISVSTVFDANSEKAKQMLIDNPEFEQYIKNGKLTFNWEKSVSNLGDGLSYELDKAMDYGRTLEEANIRKDGRLTQNMMVGDARTTRVSTDAEGIDNLVTTQLINSKDIITNQVVQSNAKAKATAIVQGEPNKMMDFLRTTLKVDESIVTDKGFNDLSVEDKIDLLTSLQVEKAVGFALNVDNIKKRKATQEDVDFYNKNAKAIEQGQSIEPLKVGDDVYYTEIRKTVSSITPKIPTSDKNIMSKETWESYKESGYQPSGTFRFDWDPVRKAFVQMKLTVSDGAVVAQETGQIARSPQELGNLTGQTIKNYQGFEIQDPMRPTTGEARERELQEEIFSGVNT